jgi:hypothetical protein
MSFLAVGGVIAGLVVGCSQFRREQRAEWRGEAERACLRTGTIQQMPHATVAKALEGPGMCGADHPIRISAFTTRTLEHTASFPGSGGGAAAARLSQPGTLTCPMTTALQRWMDEVVQPAARARFGMAVTEVRTMGTYSCRPINNARGNRLSEHAFANAIDIGGFRLADNTIITLARGWHGDLNQQHFLREVHAGACRHFSTVLGPGYNALHYDHFHFDMARHGRSGNRSVCRPYPQAVPPPMDRPLIDPAQQLMARAQPGQMRDEPDARGQGRAYAETRDPFIRELMRRRELAAIEPRPQGLPAVPRNPNLDDEVRNATLRPGRPAGPPVMLYGRGNGPFLPLKEHEVTADDTDPITGTVGE